MSLPTSNVRPYSDWKQYNGFLKSTFTKCGLKWVDGGQGVIWAEKRVETLHDLWSASDYPMHMDFEDFLIKTMSGDGTGDAIIRDNKQQ